MTSPLDQKKIEQFIHDGYLKIENAFSLLTAHAALDLLWNDIPFNRHDASTWKEPVVRLGMYPQQPFVDSVNSPELHAVFNQLIGDGKWIPCTSIGSFPVRFPSKTQAVDTGKHVDAGFPGEDPGNYLEWRVNIKSKGRALLMLLLYSDVSINDAPTIIYKGSHLDVARLLEKEGAAGLSFMELAAKLDGLPERGTALATGDAGTIYLCHPFLVHAAQQHKGNTPKFMAQPPLLLKTELDLTGATPVEQAIRLGLRR